MLYSISICHRLFTKPEFVAPSPVEPGAVKRLSSSQARNLAGLPEGLGRCSGKVLLVNCWSTWCAPCREEMPALSRLSRRFSGERGQFVGVATDSLENVRRYAPASPTAYPLLIAENAPLEQSRALWNSRQALPSTVLIDARGVVRPSHLGTIDEAKMAASIQQRLAAPGRVSAVPAASRSLSNIVESRFLNNVSKNA